tara:strand:- start:231 stop:1928 length:1698 start_codon:yes stop_codon:yes gene_type:complete
MLTPGARAKKFIRPRGSNAIFAAKRGQLAPSPIKESQTTPDQKTKSRFGKAFSGDYTKFFGAKRTTKAMRGAVKAIKDILVETFAAAMSLGATIRNIVKQLSGLGAGRAGGGGLLGKLGMVGLIAAVVAGVAAIFGPKIKEVFESFKAGANQVFENVKGFLDGIEQKIISIYNFVRDLYNNKFKGLLKAYNDSVQFLADKTAISVYKIPLGQFKDIPAYTDQFPDGLNPLTGKTLDSVMGDVGNMFKGGLDNTTGVIGDLFNNMLSGLGLTDTANAITETLGAGTLFGPNRQLGSGGGLSTFFPGLKPKPSSSTTSSSSSSPSGATGGSQSQMEVAQTLVTEFKAQGLSGEGAKLATAEIGRENSLNINTILGTHDDGGVTAYGAISWQGGRERVLFDELRSRGIAPTKEGLANSANEGVKANAAAMVKEMKSRGNTELLGLLQKQTLTDAEKDKVRQLMKDQYFVYNQSIPIQRSRDWYDRVNSFGLQSMVQTAPPDSQIPSVSRSSENIAMVMPAPPAAPSVPRRPQPIMTGNGSGTEGSDYNFYPPGSSDLFDVYGSQLGIA